jgi:prepilin-type N-terminal cleavage/methylation domain-containing protein
VTSRKPEVEELSGRTRAGFSLVELVIALVIMSIGILGLAGTTMYMIRQVTLAEVTTERAQLYQRVIETIKSLPYDSISTGSDTVGNFRYRFSTSSGTQSKTILIEMQGPGMKALIAGQTPSMSPSVTDSVTIAVIKP